MRQVLDSRRITRLALLAVVLAALAAVLWPAGPQAGSQALSPSPPALGEVPVGATAMAALSPAPAEPSAFHAVQQPMAGCPRQRLEVSTGGQPARPACVDPTRISQTGNVRSYLAAGSGRAAWALRVDMAGSRLLAVRLREGGGPEYACEEEACQGLHWARHGTRGVRSLQLESVALAQAGRRGTAQATVSATLEIPGEDAFSAPGCEGPVVTLHAPDGSAQRFCGQGGAGVELTDAGWFTYRFEDAEGRTLAVAVDSEQQVAEVRYGPWSCRGAACTGATASGAAPGSEWTGRTFFFGRTPLFGAAKAEARAATPQLLLEGSLALPSGES